MQSHSKFAEIQTKDVKSSCDKIKRTVKLHFKIYRLESGEFDLTNVQSNSPDSRLYIVD